MKKRQTLDKFLETLNKFPEELSKLLDKWPIKNLVDIPALMTNPAAYTSWYK